MVSSKLVYGNKLWYKGGMAQRQFLPPTKTAGLFPHPLNASTSPKPLPFRFMVALNTCIFPAGCGSDVGVYEDSTATGNPSCTIVDNLKTLVIPEKKAFIFSISVKEPLENQVSIRWIKVALLDFSEAHHPTLNG